MLRDVRHGELGLVEGLYSNDRGRIVAWEGDKILLRGVNGTIQSCCQLTTPDNWVFEV